MHVNTSRSQKNRSQKHNTEQKRIFWNNIYTMTAFIYIFKIMQSNGLHTDI